MGMTVIQPGTSTRSQAITDIITSVALEQTAISSILNAEGEKIQKAIANAITIQEMLDVNQSVGDMLNSITQLETILQSKLELFSDCLCQTCSTSTTSTTTTSTTTTSTTTTSTTTTSTTTTSTTTTSTTTTSTTTTSTTTTSTTTTSTTTTSTTTTSTTTTSTTTTSTTTTSTTTTSTTTTSTTTTSTTTTTTTTSTTSTTSTTTTTTARQCVPINDIQIQKNFNMPIINIIKESDTSFEIQNIMNSRATLTFTVVPTPSDEPVVFISVPNGVTTSGNTFTIDFGVSFAGTIVFKVGSGPCKVNVTVKYNTAM